MRRYFNISHFAKAAVVFTLITTILFGLSPISFNHNIFAPKKAEADAWWDVSWQRRIKVTFTNGSRGALANFPAMVALNSSRVTYADFLANGNDIRFVDADGTTVLDYEVERWNVSGTSTVWVRIPQIDSSSNTDYIYMYYKNSGASAGANPTGVWDSDYVSVLHMGDDPQGTAPQMQDSTSNNRDATSTAATATTSIDAFIGKGLDLNGVTQYAQFSSTTLPTGIASGTVELYYNPDTFAADANGRYLFTKDKSGTFLGEWRLFLGTEGAVPAQNSKLSFRIECPTSLGGNGNAWAVVSDTAPATAGGWFYTAAVWDKNGGNGNMKLYWNGNATGTAYIDTTATTTANPNCGMDVTGEKPEIGRNNGKATPDGYFDGQIDEFRISKIVRSADWINASYTSGSDALNTYAAAESAPDTTAPVISNVATSTTGSTATITWDTNESATSTVEYGTTTSYGLASSSNTGVTSHTYTLTGLDSSTEYHFKISVWDSSGNLATSSDLTFTTTGPTPPGQPTGLLTYPYEGRAYARWTAATGTVTDYKVEYKLTSEPTTWTTFSDGVSTATSTMITGLTNDSSYHIRVTAMNGVSLGLASATSTVTPRYLMTFVSPTIGSGNSTTSTNLTAYASTTSSLTPSYFTFRLETSGGSLISNSTTSTRYGDYALNHLTELSHRVDLSLTVTDLSGQVYVPTTDTLFTVHNNQSKITEVDRSGNTVRTITCSGCGDIEDITLVSSVASSTVGGYDHTFMISTEDVDINNLQIFRVVIHSTGAVTVNRNDYYSTGLKADATNDGLEGIAYNSNTDTYFVSVEGQATQSTQPKIYEVTLGSGHNTSTTTVCSNLNFRTYLTEDNTVAYGNTAYADISGLDYVPSVNRLYVISHKGDEILEVDVSNRNSCVVLNELEIAMRADSGANHDFEMPEGVSWDSTGDYMYVSAESDYWSTWRTNVYNVQKTFTGLASGNYNLYTSVTDSFGNTSTSSVRSFTVGADVTAPTITNISSDKANGTYGVGEVIDIDITFSENVTSTGNATVTLETGSIDGTCTFTVSNSNTATCNYTVQAGATSTDLTVASVSGVIADQSANSMSNFTPSTNLAANKAIVVDAAGPIISAVASSTSATAATTTWTTDEVSHSRLMYGTAAGTYTASSTDATLVTSHTRTVTGLSADTVYYFIVISADALGNTSTSSEYTFKTPDITPPVISSIATSTGSTTATVSWSTNETAASSIAYGLTTSYGANSTSSATSTHSVSLSGLTSGTTYHFRVLAIDTSTNIATSADYTFTTTADVTAPGISSVVASPSLTTAFITWVTNEAASSSVSYGTTTTYGTTATSSGDTTHSVSLSNLVENTTYHYNVYAMDAYGNVSTTTDGVFTTSATPVATTVTGSAGGGVSTILVPQQQQAQDQNIAQTNVGGSVIIGRGLVIKNNAVQGKKGIEVKLIQQVLNLDPKTQIAKKGVGSPGKETNLYGPATRAAVQKFQLKYGIVKSPKDKGYGIVGPATRKKMNEILSGRK